MSCNWLKNCDLLHIPMSLSYKNEYFYATNVGAFLTIICFIYVVILSLYEIKSLSEKSSFSIITNQYIDLSEKIDFSQRPLLFQLIDNTGEIMDINDKLYEFKAYDMEWLVETGENGKKNYRVINTKLEMGKCDEVLQNKSEYLKEYNLSRYICIKSDQNITSYGYLGDMNNGYKGFRIYLNKCNGKSYCYDDSVIIQKLQNIKFRVTYLGLNTNIFNLGKELNYQMFSKSCSISTNLLKKIYFTFSIGRFHLSNNIFYKKKKIFNYIIGNDPKMDIDLDPKSTIDKNRNTLAYFSFNFDGNIVEVSKEVKRFYDTLSFIGNTFNIILTIIKIINNYYSNKVLFVDIFKHIFFSKEYKDKDIKLNKFEKESFYKSLYNNNNDKNSNKKHILDLSDGIGFNNINNSNILKKSSNKIVMTFDKSKDKKRVSHIYTINKERITKNKLMYYYMLPLCILRKHKSFNNICIIKDKICSFFSIEKINELNKFKDTLDQKARKTKMYNTEFIKINKKYDESNDSKDFKDINKNS